MQKIIKSIFPVFLPFALTITLLCGIIYIVAQQSYRMSANDPQIQLAEDIATQIATGISPQYFIPNVKIDISKSLGTFIMAYDKTGNLIGESAVLNGKTIKLPQGVLTDTKRKTETRFTWQPQKGVRSAVVVAYYKGNQEGFIAIGRSLREVEKREDNLAKMVFLGWIITEFSILGLIFLHKKFT
jgi:hypothetical protein